MSELTELLVKVQNELHAPKNQFNKFGNYKYRNQEDILEAVKPLLLKHSLTLTIFDDLVFIGDRYYIKATCGLRHGSNEVKVTAFAREQQTRKGMDESQVTGSASSYARKYALNGMFLIDDTKDADSMDNSPSKKTAPAKTTAKPQVKKPKMNATQYSKLKKRITEAILEDDVTVLIRSAKDTFDLAPEQLNLIEELGVNRIAEIKEGKSG